MIPNQPWGRVGFGGFYARPRSPCGGPGVLLSPVYKYDLVIQVQRRPADTQAPQPAKLTLAVECKHWQGAQALFRKVSEYVRGVVEKG